MTTIPTTRIDADSNNTDASNKDGDDDVAFAPLFLDCHNGSHGVGAWAVCLLARHKSAETGLESAKA